MQTPGLIVAPLTPFTDDLAVDEPALKRQIDYVVTDGGATMVVAAGVETQEYTYLSFEQRKARPSKGDGPDLACGHPSRAMLRMAASG